MSIVSDSYAKDPNREWERLTRRPYNTLEFAITMHFLSKHLPAGSTILDAGGGPGRYAIHLCRSGHSVTLLDLTPALLDLARDKVSQEPKEVRSRLAEFVQGDLRDLSRFADASFDATICLGGAISHLPQPEDHLRAMSELARVTRPGGLVFVAAIGYLAVLRTTLLEAPYELVDDGIMDRFFATGNALACGGMDWHFFRAQELADLAESCGLAILEMAGCQGLSAGLPEATNSVAGDQQQWNRWMDILLSTASEPAVADMSEHILYIGRKK